MSTTRTSPARRSRLLAPAIALVAVGALGLANLGGDSDEGGAPATAPSEPATPDTTVPRPTSDASEQAPVLPDMARREDADPRARGELDAPVVMVMWSDFQCPFCGRFARETGPALVDRYVEEGVLRIEWRDFPYLGPESTEAALAGRAAAAQGAFWAFHDAVYADAFQPNSGSLSRENLLQVARDLDLDMASFEATMDDPDTEAAVQQEFLEAQELGITGTPAFLVNGRPVLGAQPVETFAQLIETAAAEGT